MSKVTPKRRLRKLTEERKQAYIEAVRETGSYIEAARIVSAHATGPRSGVGTFDRARVDDPEFGEACREALLEAMGELEAAVHKRALNGVLVERRTAPDGSVIERWQHDFPRERASLARHLPEWRAQQQLDVNANVEATAQVKISVDMAVVMAALPKEAREAGRTYLAALKDAQGAIEAARAQGVNVTEELAASGGLDDFRPSLKAVACGMRSRPNHTKYGDTDGE